MAANKTKKPAPKDSVFLIRISSGMLKELRQRAAQNERSVSEEIRQAVLASLRKGVAA